MHEAISTNGVGVAVHEEDSDSLYERLVREVTALNAQYDQLRARHSEYVRQVHDAEERANKARRDKDAAKKAYTRALEKSDGEIQRANEERATARTKANEITPQVTEVRRVLRKRETQLATEMSERTPRQVKP